MTPSPSIKRFSNAILEFHSDPYTVFNDMLDVFIAAFTLGKQEEIYERIKSKYGSEKMTRFSEMLAWVIIDLEKREDLLGDVYMELSSKSKASAFGQFFTPMHMCIMMSQLLGNEKKGSVMDPACGSGRMILAAGFEMSDFDKLRSSFFAVDLDPTCIKMCVVNAYLFGLKGYYVCGDSLALKASFGYQIFINDQAVPEIRVLTEEEINQIFQKSTENFVKEDPKSALAPTAGIQLTMFEL